MSETNGLKTTESVKNEMDLKSEINKLIAQNNEKIENKHDDIQLMENCHSKTEFESKIQEEINFLQNQKKEIFEKAYLQKKLIESGVSSEILNNINDIIENKKQDTYNNIINKRIPFELVNRSVDEIILDKMEKIKNKEMNLIEENIRLHKIKDIKENKDNIENKIRSLQENIKILQNNELNSSIGGREIIDDNIRKSRIKEVKSKKETLENKLLYLDEQIQSLMKIEEQTNLNKKFNLKQYLDNFEKDKKEAEIREQKWKKDHEQRVKAFEEQQQKIQEKLKEKAENENLYLNLKKHENYSRKLEQIKLNAQNHREEVQKLAELKEEWKNNPISDKNYLFKVLEEDFQKKKIQTQEEEKKRLESELTKIKQNYKPITKEEIENFKKKYDDQRQKLIYEKEKERLLKKEELMQRNMILPKPDTRVHQKVIEEDKKLKEMKEKEKIDKIYNKLKIQQFSKVIQTNMIPKVDPGKKKEIEERIQSEGQRPKRLENKRSGRVILKKPDPSKPKKYGWELKLNNSNASGNGKQNNSLSRAAFSNSILNQSRPFTGEDKLKSSKSISKDVKNPLIKIPDYLTEMRNKKMMMEIKANNTNPELRPENIEQIKIKAQLLEEQAKMKERLLHLNGGAHKNPEIGEDVSNMLIDAIKAKLTILETISKKK